MMMPWSTSSKSLSHVRFSLLTRLGQQNDIITVCFVCALWAPGRPEEALGRQAAAGAAHAVFEAFAAGALKDVAAALDCEDDDEAEEGGAAAKADEWMGRLALLGRAAAGKTLPLLASLLGQKLQQLQAFAAAGLHTPYPPVAAALPSRAMPPTSPSVSPGLSHRTRSLNPPECP